MQGSPSEVSIHNTLLELYLADDLQATAIAKAALSGPVPVPSSLEAEEAERERKERRKKALALLKAGWPPHEPQPKYDPDLAVVLCQMHGFREGRLFLYEKMRLYKEVRLTSSVKVSDLLATARVYFLKDLPGCVCDRLSTLHELKLF